MQLSAPATLIIGLIIYRNKPSLFMFVFYNIKGKMQNGIEWEEYFSLQGHHIPTDGFKYK